MAENPALKAENEALIKAKKEECDRIIAENRELIKRAKFDHEHCDKEYAKNCVK